MVDINPSLRCNHCLGGLDAREGFFMSSCKHLFCGACGRTGERKRAARPQCNVCPRFCLRVLWHFQLAPRFVCADMPAANAEKCPCCETGCQFMELNDMSLRSQDVMRNGITELVQARSTELMWEQAMEKAKSVESFNRLHNFRVVFTTIFN